MYGHRAPIVMCTYSIINYFSHLVIKSIGVVNRNNCVHIISDLSSPYSGFDGELIRGQDKGDLRVFAQHSTGVCAR